MSEKLVKGKIHSFQSLGTLDGPGVRFVVFMQGCPLRCAVCHNPDTWDFEQGKLFSAQQIVDKVLRYKEYFGAYGGITLSGGEPLMQAQFIWQLFSLCKANGINTCLDTSGCVLNDEVKGLLSVTDRVLLDIKYTEPDLYEKHVGMQLESALNFLRCLQQMGVPTTIRQVIVPTINDNEENIIELKNLQKAYNVIDKIELLPFKKICQSKYDKLKIDFPFKNLPVPTKEKMEYLNSLLD